MHLPERRTPSTYSWNQLIAHFASPLRRWIRLRLEQSGAAVSEDVIEDLVQDVYCRLAQRHGPSLEGLHTRDPAQMTGYVATVARHIVIDFVRYHHAEKRGANRLCSLSSPTSALPVARIEDPRPTPEQELLRREGLRELCGRLATLAPRSRTFRQRLATLVRIIVLGWTRCEAAHTSGLGLSEGAIHAEFFRLRHRAQAARCRVRTGSQASELGEGGES